MRTKRRALRIVAKCKLQKTHTWEMELLAQSFYGRSDDAQIFGNDWQFAKCTLQCQKQIFSRTFDPAAVDRLFFVARYLPIRFKAAEVVEPHHIEHGEGCAKALDPPLISIGGQQVPAINRISPKLSRGAEIIGRHS